MESKDKRTGWLAELKVGDKVFVRSSRIGRDQIAPIEKITPTGRIVIRSLQFDPITGRAMGQSYYREWLGKVTPEALKEHNDNLRKARLNKEIRSRAVYTVLEAMSLDDLIKVNELLGGEKI